MNEKIPTLDSINEFCNQNNITEDLILGYIEILYKDRYVLNTELFVAVVKFLYKKFEKVDEDQVISGIIQFFEG